jgi:hypothetical protein
MNILNIRPGMTLTVKPDIYDVLLNLEAKNPSLFGQLRRRTDIPADQEYAWPINSQYVTCKTLTAPTVEIKKCSYCGSMKWQKVTNKFDLDHFGKFYKNKPFTAIVCDGCGATSHQKL